ncbi:DUF806 family protein [Furfurilactobacillus entadae]|uniref:DUF806 family protein n=1 Tax=Furfurilactobacillus entadae TaxID=2922307 RepID=UPI0035EDF816
MELPAITGENLIKSASLDWIDNVYRTSIPDDVIGNTDTTDVLVTEYLNEPARYGNSRFKGWSIGVEVQVFYKDHLDHEFNMMGAEIGLAKLFEKNGWSVSQSRDHIKDPDTRQMSKVFYFTKNLNLTEEDLHG